MPRNISNPDPLHICIAMEVKTAAWGTVSLVIVAFGAVVIFAIEREGIKNDLVKARNGWSGQQSLLDTRRATLANRQEAYDSLQDRIASIQSISERIRILEGKNADVQKQIDGLRGEWETCRAAFARDIDQVRQKTKDEALPEIVLMDETRLKKARFNQIKDNIVILEHADGIARVPLTNMPQDWVGRLALGWNPKLTAELSGKPDEAIVVAVEEKPVQTVEMVQAEQRASVKRADVGDALAKITSLQKRIAEAERARSGQLKIAQEYGYKHQLAQSKGNTSSHNVKRDEATAIAENMARQISAAQEQIQKLNAEIAAKQEAFR